MNKIIVISIFVIFFLVGFGGFVNYFLIDKNSSSEPVSELAEGYQEKEYQTAGIYQSILSKCPDKSPSCFEENTGEITKEYGPTASLDVLKFLQDSGALEKTVDDHQIAHVVGRDTAKFFGINGEAFLSCPTSFNYGCQHGFFEYAHKGDVW